MRLIRFLKYNDFKGMTVKAYFLSAWYRFQIVTRHPDKLRKNWGVEGEESPDEVDREQLKYAAQVSGVVSHICNRTKWESKCLVRALTAQNLLHKRGIKSTMYLGCAMEDGKMVAHAWVRVGKIIVTGANGVEYAIVDKFVK